MARDVAGASNIGSATAPILLESSRARPPQWQVSWYYRAARSSYVVATVIVTVDGADAYAIPYASLILPLDTVTCTDYFPKSDRLPSYRLPTH